MIFIPESHQGCVESFGPNDIPTDTVLVHDIYDVAGALSFC